MLKGILEGFNLPANPRVALSDFATGETVSHLQPLLPDAAFLSATSLLRPMRVIKTEADIDLMREARAHHRSRFRRYAQGIATGHDRAGDRRGSQLSAAQAWLAGASPSPHRFYNSGPNHPLLFGARMESWHRTLDPPVCILFDFGGIYEGWCYDFGRTVFFGEPDDEAQRVYEVMMASQAAGVAALKAGEATTTDADQAARRVIEEAGYGEAFRHPPRARHRHGRTRTAFPDQRR